MRAEIDDIYIKLLTKKIAVLLSSSGISLERTEGFFEKISQGK